MTKLSYVIVALVLSAGVSRSAKASGDTVVADYGVPPIVQRKTLVITPEKLYLLTTFLDKGYPFAADDTKDILPLILRTQQGRQQYFVDTAGSVNSLYSGKYVKARDLGELARALSDYSLKTFQEPDLGATHLPGFHEYQTENSRRALLTAIDVMRLPLSLTPPRYIVSDSYKMLGAFAYSQAMSPLLSLGDVSKAVNGLTSSDPSLATATKARIQSIWQTRRQFSKEYNAFFNAKDWRTAMQKESSRTAAFARLNQEELKFLRREMPLLKNDINTMFDQLKKSQSTVKR